MWRLLPICLITLLSFGNAFLPPGGAAALAQGGSDTPVERDMDEEVLRLRSEMLKMKMDYEGKLQKMEERLGRLEDENPRTANHTAFSPDSSATLRTAQMTPEEKAKLEEELKTLMGEKKETEAPHRPTPSYQLPSAEPAYPAGGFLQRIRPGVFQSYNPDISVIGDFTGQFFHPGRGRGDFNWEENRFEHRDVADRFAMREIELGLQSAIDPYARADIFLSYSEGGVAIEEGFMTLLTLPKGFQAKIGRFHPAFGKNSRTHRPETFQVDYPLVIRNIWGEDGPHGNGLSVSWLIPNPWNKFIELTGEVLTTRDTNQFFYVTHLKNFFDLTPNSSFDAGLTGLTGNLETDHEKGSSQAHADIVGTDLTYRWKPVTYRLKPYKSFLSQTEAYFTQVSDRVAPEPTTGGILGVNNSEHSWGAFTSAEYQLTRRNYVGLRLDYAQALANHSNFEWDIIPYWTFWQSDFARWRLQYTHTWRSLDSFKAGPTRDDDAFMLQATFSIGIHRPHPF